MTLWKRLKNLWKLSGTEFLYSINDTELETNKVLKIIKREMENDLKKFRPATIVEDTPEPFDELLDNQEENDKTDK